MSKLTYNKIKEYLGLEQSPKKKGKGKAKKTNGRWQIKDRRQFVFRVVLIGVIFFGVVLIVGLIGLGVMVIVYSKDLPPPGKAFSKNIAQSTNIYDRNGVLLASLHGDVQRTWIPLSSVDHNMQWAMLSAEDVNFYSEPGIDVFAILRAALSDVIHHGQGGLQGGSTITQQLVKNADLSDDQTLQRKIKEIILTLEVEKEYSKAQILEAYLNEISFGGDTSGIKVAAEDYFNVEPNQLDLAQSAFIAGLAQAPSYYSPVFGEDPILSDGNLASTDRAYYVLDEMLKYSNLTGVTSSQVAAAKIEIKNFKFSAVISNYKAPYFVNYVNAILDNDYGTQNVLTGGYQVYTTLDYNMQQEAEAEVNKMYANFGNQLGYKGEDAAMVSIDPKTGEVIAMVGSPKVFTDPKTGKISTSSSGAQYLTNVNIVTSGSAAQGGSGIQPGSSIKPLLYMSAFKNLGLAPTSLMPDIPISIPSYDGFTYPSPYTPTNFEGNYNGLFDIDKDLSISLNVPAVETLYSLTPTKLIQDLQAFGYTNLTTTNQAADLSYAVGGESVVFLDHVDAYAMMADGGTLHPATTITKITDASGKVIYQYDPNSAASTAIDPAYPYMMSETLNHYQYLESELQAYDPTFYKAAYVSHTYDIAGKTGTNNTTTSSGAVGPASSLTFVGYTPDLVSGFWYGNEASQGTALSGDPIAENIIPYWGDYMAKVLPKYPHDSFQRPADVVTAQICTDTGLLYQSGVSCPMGTGIFQKNQVPKVDDEHVTAQVCPNQPTLLATPAMIAAGQSVTKSYTEFKTFDSFFQSSLDTFLHNTNVVPTQYCTTAQGLQVSIDPFSQTTYSAGSTVNVSAEVAETNSSNTVNSVDVDFNNNQVGTLTHTSGTNYSGSFTIPSGTQNGTYQVSVVAIDSTNAQQTASADLNVGSSNSNSGSNDVTITAPSSGSKVLPSPATTSLQMNDSQGGSGISSAYFVVYQNGQVVNTNGGSNISATEQGNSGNFSASYQFPISTTPFYVTGCVVSNGTTACSNSGVTVTE
jgi:penicillin-binding protein 1A